MKIKMDTSAEVSHEIYWEDPRWNQVNRMLDREQYDRAEKAASEILRDWNRE